MKPDQFPPKVPSLTDSLKNEPRLARRHCGPALDAVWDKAIAEGRAMLETQDAEDPFTSKRKHELHQVGREYIINSRGQHISLSPDSPESQALLEALEGKI